MVHAGVDVQAELREMCRSKALARAYSILITLYSSVHRLPSGKCWEPPYCLLLHPQDCVVFMRSCPCIFMSHSRMHGAGRHDTLPHSVACCATGTPMCFGARATSGNI
jgi:hypothetical protein